MKKTNKPVKQPFFMPTHVERYKTQTADLSTLEHGAMYLLKLHYWSTGPIRNDDVILARVAGLTLREWRSVKSRIQRFFDTDGDTWINYEWDEELRTAYDRIQAASKSGTNAANTRWGRERLRRENDMRSQCDPNADALRSHNERNASAMQTKSIGGQPPMTPAQARVVDGFSSVPELSLEAAVTALERFGFSGGGE